MYLIYMIATFQIFLEILSCYSLQGTTELVCYRTKIQINSFCINNFTLLPLYTEFDKYYFLC